MIDPGVARSIEGVVFDVDDTLTREGVLEREAYDALFALRDAGLRRIAVTGRPTGWCDVMAALWPIDLAIGENGGGWAWREGRVTRCGSWETDRAVQDEQYARSLELVGLVLREMPDIVVSSDMPHRSCDVAFDVGETRRVPPERVRALVALIEREGWRTMVSTVHVHAIPGPWDKATGAVRAMREVLGVGEEQARTRYLFVGDSGNDAAAFGFFEHTAGVANVRDHLHALPRAPRWIASRDRGLGFAEIVASILAGRS